MCGLLNFLQAISHYYILFLYVVNQEDLYEWNTI
jgi:hypothetical protein